MKVSISGYRHGGDDHANVCVAAKTTGTLREGQAISGWTTQ